MVEIVDNWFGAEGERDGMPTFMRGRGELQPLIGLPSIRTCCASPGNSSPRTPPASRARRYNNA